MSSSYPLSKPFFNNAEVDSVKDVIESGWVTQGPACEKFEQSINEYVGSKYCTVVSNGTVGLELALKSVGVSYGDIVLTVSHSFIATANSVRSCGAEPWFVDIEKNGFNISIESLSNVLKCDCSNKDGDLYLDQNLLEKISSSKHSNFKNFKNIGRVAAIMVVHQFGFSCDIEAINKLAQDFDLPIVEDAACALGAKYPNGKWIGDSDNVCVFSFHPRKIITTGDGGAITTNCAKKDEFYKLYKNHGLNREAKNKKDIYSITGSNYRMTDIQAALGIEQLKKLGQIVSSRVKLANHYASILNEDERFFVYTKEGANYQSLPLFIISKQINVSEFINYLKENLISAKEGILNAHKLEPYIGDWKLENSEFVSDWSVLLPLYNGLSFEDVEVISKRILEYGK